MFVRELIIPRVFAKDRWDVIDQLGKLMSSRGFVLPSYAERVKDREREAPTALPIEPLNVAIPHDGIDACLLSGIAVGVLERPVPWIEMATVDKWIDVNFVFLLSITEPEKHAVFLRRLIDRIQKPGTLSHLRTLDNSDAIYDFLM